jgi:hypothetical protein
MPNIILQQIPVPWRNTNVCPNMLKIPVLTPPLNLSTSASKYCNKSNIAKAKEPQCTFDILNKKYGEDVRQSL